LILIFLQEIARRRHLYDSPEFRQFILNPVNLAGVKEPWHDKASKYQAAFPKWDNFVVSENDTAEILARAQKLKLFLDQIKAVKNSCKRSGQHFQQVKNCSGAVNSALKDYSAEFYAFASGQPPLFSGASRSVDSNSFSSLHGQFKVLEAKARAMVDTLERIKAIEVLSDKLRNHLRSSNVGLIDMQTGKLTLKTMFHKRNEAGLLAQETLVKQTEDNLNGIATVRRIGMTRLLKEELPWFLTHLKTLYSQTLDSFARNTSQELSCLTHIWRPLSVSAEAARE
jgi:hypothetical protein